MCVHVCVYGGELIKMEKHCIKKKVTIRLGENADRQQYLRDSSSACVEVKLDIKYIKIMSWSL